MSDPASVKTDKEIKKLEKKINEIYTEAEKDIQKKLDTFNEKFLAKDAILMQKVNDGEIDKKDYMNWLNGQVFQGNQWQAKKDQIIDTIQNANNIAKDMVNGNMAGVFAFNGNYAAYQMESGEGINFGFNLYDSATVVNLVKNNPQILPKWKIDEEKDYKWNAKKVNNAITQGIIQGEKLSQITDRLTTGLCAQNENLMKTFARTGMTQAQNAGRYYRQMEAKQKGIEVVKEWMATLDNHTRDSHAAMDGEQVKVGDMWHPMKFSNGCRYPGDPLGPPQEVYNCRCTLVSDVLKYPAEYERYDNIDGKPIKNMTYEEWHKAKESGKASIPQPVIDYDEYGGKEIYDTLSKYDNFDDFVEHSGPTEYGDVVTYYDNLPGDTATLIDNAIKDIHQEEKNIEKAKKEMSKEEKEKKKQEKALEKAEKKVADLEDEIAAKGADHKFEGIWYNQTVTYADYEDKKDSIESKKEWYDNKIQYKKDQLDEDLFEGEKGTTQIFLDHDSLEDLLNDEDAMKVLTDIDKLGMDEDDVKNAWTALYGHPEGTIDSKSDDDLKTIQKFEDKIKELEEFEAHGEEYSNLLEELKEAKQEVKDLTPKPDITTMFGPDAYTQERKDNAVWAKSPKEADNVLRDKCGEVWRDATDAERDAIYEYTQSYHKYNEPLRGIEYGSNRYLGVGNTDLDAGYAHNGARLNAMTDIIDKSSYEHDMWFQRGCNYGGMDKFFNCSEDLLRYGTQSELEQALLGTTPTEYGFMSMGSSKGTGFSSKPIKLNIYAPGGTKMMYVEPFSAFGNGSGKGWNGKSTQSSFGSELETILQQNTQFRVVKVEKTPSTLYFDLEVIAQNEPQLWS